jgi:2-dehydropantoate 2-reductase
MSIAIVGPGALGSRFGAALAQSGQDVRLLGRPSAHLEAIRTEGLRLERRDGSIEQVTIEASADPAVVAGATLFIVLVKTPDTVAAMRAIQPGIAPGVIILTLQNGLGNVERIRAILGGGPLVLQGVTSQAAMRLAPGVVAHTGEGPTLIGYQRSGEKAAAEEIARIFAAAGIPAAATPDIDRAVWQKVAVNAAINGLTALGGFVNGTIAGDARLLEVAEGVAEEAAAVARARGIEVGGMRRPVLDTCLATAENRSSMLQDLDAGRHTEVDAIHGAILNAAREAGIVVPAVELLDALIRAKSRETGAEEGRNGKRSE